MVEKLRELLDLRSENGFYSFEKENYLGKLSSLQTKTKDCVRKKILKTEINLVKALVIISSNNPTKSLLNVASRKLRKNRKLFSTFEETELVVFLALFNSMVLDLLRRRFAECLKKLKKLEADSIPHKRQLESFKNLCLLFAPEKNSEEQKKGKEEFSQALLKLRNAWKTTPENEILTVTQSVLNNEQKVLSFDKFFGIFRKVIFFLELEKLFATKKSAKEALNICEKILGNLSTDKELFIESRQNSLLKKVFLENNAVFFREESPTANKIAELFMLWTQTDVEKEIKRWTVEKSVAQTELLVEQEQYIQAFQEYKLIKEELESSPEFSQLVLSLRKKVVVSYVSKLADLEKKLILKKVGNNYSLLYGRPLVDLTEVFLPEGFYVKENNEEFKKKISSFTQWFNFW